jgi:hypothetical protein
VADLLKKWFYGELENECMGHEIFFDMIFVPEGQHCEIVKEELANLMEETDMTFVDF